MKKLLFAAVLSLLCNFLVAQDLIKPTNGRSFFTKVQSIENGVVTYQDGVNKMTMPTTEVALIEFAETGVRHFNTSALQTIDPKSIASPVYQRGNKVYIPFSSKDVSQRAGALKLRELVAKDGIWKVVDCAEEAHFILEFVYSDEGKDHGYVNVKDRNGQLIAKSPKVNNSGNDLSVKGEDIAGTLYDKYIRKTGTGIKVADGRFLVSGRMRAAVIRPEIDYYLGYIGGKVTFAYQFNPYFAMGFGLGLDKGDKGNLSTPAFANVRTYFSDGKVSPYFEMKLGYAVPVKKSEYSTVKEGFLAYGSLGLQVVGIDFGITIGADHRYYCFENGRHGNGNFDTYISINLAYNLQLRKKPK